MYPIKLNKVCEKERRFKSDEQRNILAANPDRVWPLIESCIAWRHWRIVHWRLILPLQQRGRKDSLIE